MRWLKALTSPKHLVGMVKDQEGEVTGVYAAIAELPGLRWAGSYTDPKGWPGGYLCYALLRTGRWNDLLSFVQAHQPLAPLNWKHFGKPVETPILGDIAIFHNPGYVGVYLGEEENSYYVLGGTGPGKVGITVWPKSTLAHLRRINYTVQPLSLKQVFLGKNGEPLGEPL
jgi:hypothetical protein